MTRTKKTKRKASGYKPNYEYFFVHPRTRDDSYVFQHGRDVGLTWGVVRARNEAEGVTDWVDPDFMHWLLTNDFVVRERGVWVQLDRNALKEEDLMYLLDWDAVEDVFGPDEGDAGPHKGPDEGGAGAASGSKRVRVN
jgi:hypothetical protein